MNEVRRPKIEVRRPEIEPQRAGIEDHRPSFSPGPPVFGDRPTNINAGSLISEVRRSECVLDPVDFDLFLFLVRHQAC